MPGLSLLVRFRRLAGNETDADLGARPAAAPARQNLRRHRREVHDLPPISKLRAGRLYYEAEHTVAGGGVDVIAEDVVVVDALTRDLYRGF